MDVVAILYSWYVEKWESDRRRAKAATLAMGSTLPFTRHGRLTREQFVRRLRLPSRNPRLNQMWLNGLTASRESEVSQLPLPVQRFLRDARNNPPTFLDEDEDRLLNAS
jgi:hypothetical protein